jgi:N-methylhydantoinase A/oxoprolinase/acetone carboxylase beta subunit
MIYYKIGIDVGGTNTDAVLVTNDNVIISKTKQSTTADVSSGIQNALKEVLRLHPIDLSKIKYIMLGTTHCTNAMVERRDLNKVGALRLALPAAKAIPTMIDFPEDLKKLLGSHFYMVHGGFEYDGRVLHPLLENEIKGYLEKMKGEIDSLAITGIFSKINNEQELQVAKWAKEVLGDKIKISCSHLVGGLGLLERENAAIINASLKNVADKMVMAFQETVGKMGINAQLFIGQNDGTLMSLNKAKDFPVLTISSGPTNSIRGAGALSKVENGIVIDVGGTTSDGGMLVNYFPRESTQPAQIGGVLTNFRMPDVVSVGIGGGTIVRFNHNQCILGPDSVGYRLLEKGMAFGGDTLTLSDIMLSNGEFNIKNAIRQKELRQKIEDHTQIDCNTVVEKVKDQIRLKIEDLVDKLKTEAKPLPVIACGGGAFLLPKNINGASEVLFPDNREVANAFGASIAQISEESEIVINTIQKDEKVEMEVLISNAREKLFKNGADGKTIEVIIKETIPLAYLPGAVKLKVKLCGLLN